MRTHNSEPCLEALAGHLVQPTQFTDEETEANRGEGNRDVLVSDQGGAGPCCRRRGPGRRLTLWSGPVVNVFLRISNFRSLYRNAVDGRVTGAASSLGKSSFHKSSL